MDIVSSQTGTSDNALLLITEFIEASRSVWPHVLLALESKITWVLVHCKSSS